MLHAGTRAIRLGQTAEAAGDDARWRSEERRVGKECRSRRSADHKKKKQKETEAADLAKIDVREVGTALEVKDGIAGIYGIASARAGVWLELRSTETGSKVTGQARHVQ